MRVSEVYPSVQGEGPRTGQTTVFVRFGGCNLRCPGWPCDTQHAIDPAYRTEWAVRYPEELADEVEEVAYRNGAKLITLTGGEPFLQNKDQLKSFCDELWRRGYQIEAFTNGTFLYPIWAMNNVSMIIDWKLPGSGEDPHNVIRMQNLEVMAARRWSSGVDPTPDHAVKFVVKDKEDWLYAVKLWQNRSEHERNSFIWYVGKVWDSEITDAQLVDNIMANQLPWRLNVQLHNHIWDPQERGR